MIKKSFLFFRTIIFSLLLSASLSNNLLDGSGVQLASEGKNRLHTAGYSIGSTVQTLTTHTLQNNPKSSNAITNRAVRLTTTKNQANHPLPSRKSPQPKTKRVYQCSGKNGQSTFSDRPCENVIKVTSIDKLRPNIANHYQPSAEQKTNKLKRPYTYKSNKSDAYEINTRYDNLRRTIKNLLGKSKNIGFLHELEKDRNTALAMHAKSSQKYLINQKYDNLIKDIHRKKPEYQSSSVIRRLLSIERARNKELYSS